jgi:hypothetical protein
MIGLAHLVRAHTADIDADFLTVYGLDIADLGGPRLPWGRFRALLLRLPHTARSLRAIGGRVDHWDETTHLAAAQLDATRQTNFLVGALLTAHGARKNPIPKPEPVPRPGADPSASKAKRRKGFRHLFEQYGTHVRSTD